MSTNINLLLHADEESLKRRKRVKILNFLAIASLLSVGLISLFIFALIQVMNPSSVKNDQDEILQKMSILQDRQAKLFVLNNRVENIDQILKTKKNLSIVLGGVLEKVPNRLTVENLQIDNNIMLLTAQSNSLSVIGELINGLTDMVRKKDKINSLTINSLTLDENKGVYQLSISSEL